MPTRPQPAILAAGALVVAMAAGWVLTGSVAATDRVVVVQLGETLSQIALEQGVTVGQLVSLNDIADPNRILAGQRLRLAPATPAPATEEPASKPASTHTVAYGENLTGIARRYGTTVAALTSVNGLVNPSYIRTGQVLTIPGAGGEEARPTAPRAASKPASTHTVAYGENLTGIARRYGTTVAALTSVNGLVNPSYIRSGQVLTIPGAGGEAAAAVPAPQLPAGMATLAARREPMRSLIAAEARRQGVPPAFALAVAWQESGWQQNVVSAAGAIGVMQLIPATGDWVSQAMLGEPVNLRDAASNVRAGVRLLRHYLDRYGGNRSLVLAAYYQGQTAADWHGVYPVSRPYIASILRLEEIFSR